MISEIPQKGANQAGAAVHRRAAESAEMTAGQLEALFVELGVNPHPILRLPSLGWLNGLIKAQPSAWRTELLDFLRKRQRRIELAESDPLHYGFESEAWHDADALLSGTFQASGTLWPEGALLGIFGGNRAQKTWYAVKRACQTATLFHRARLAILSETETSSITTVQALAWYYLAPLVKHLNGKRDARDAVTKVSYSQANGFSDRKLVLPNGSEIYFLTYNQDPADYEGWEFGAPANVYESETARLKSQGAFVPPNVGAVADESMPLIWLQMLARRCKFRKAKLLWPFTPVKGITPAIKELVGGSAVTVSARPSELVPRPPLPDVPAGQMPYVRACSFIGARAYAIYFFTEFNRFGPSTGRTYYDEVKDLCAGKDTGYVERVAYGFARDSVARAFPTFGAWNVIKSSALPAKGTNYMFTDPAGSRNWATMWVRVSAENPPSYFIYRDWPDARTYGEWAVATEREVNETNRTGWDGDIGPAQNGMGLGVTGYKKMFLECERIRPATPGKKMINLSEEELAREFPDPQARARVRRALRTGEPLDRLQEEIYERYIDPRAGAAPHLAEAGGTCIIEEFEEVQVDARTQVVTGPSMELIAASGVGRASGGEDNEGMTLLNELLSWNQEAPLVALLNAPRLFVSEECQQVIWMFENFTGRGGAKGACKDFADLCRYMALAKLDHYEASESRGRPGRGF